MKRFRLALFGLVPVVILLAGQFASYRALHSPAVAARTRLESRGAEIEAHLGTLLGEARDVAQRALHFGPEAARSSLPRSFAHRLEGAGVLRGGDFTSWVGTSAEVGSFGPGRKSRARAALRCGQT